MTSLKWAGLLGATLNQVVVDRGTLAPTASPQTATLGHAAPAGDPPPGLLGDRGQPRWMREAVLKGVGRIGEARMNPSALLGLLPLYREQWQRSVAVSSRNSDNASYWAMHFERVSQLLAFYASARGQHILELDKLLQKPAGDLDSRSTQVYAAIGKWFKLKRADALLYGDNADDPFETEVLAAAAVAWHRHWNELCKVAIPALRREFYQVSRLGASTTVGERRAQRKTLGEILYGAAVVAASRPDRADSAGPASPVAEVEPPLPLSFSDIVAMPLSIERQKELLGGMFASDELDEVVKDIAATAAVAVTEMKKLMVEDALAGIKDARRRIESASALSGTEKLKMQVLVEEDLAGALHYLLGMERQRQLGFGTVSPEDFELKRLAVEAEQIMQRWKGGAKPAFKVQPSAADFPLTNGGSAD